MSWKRYTLINLNFLKGSSISLPNFLIKFGLVFLGATKLVSSYA